MINQIPTVIIMYNNHLYVKIMIEQLQRYYINDIIIIDNCSTWEKTKEFKNNLTSVKLIELNQNFGHNVWKKKFIYKTLPEKFILTDPDIKFNKNLPSNFLEELINVSDEYKTPKCGFALDISEPHKFYPSTGYMTDPGIGAPNETIESWESQFWKNSVLDCSKEMYYASIDTTFCLVTKKYQKRDIHTSIRIAGNFTAKHLPWYIEDEYLTIQDKIEMYNNTLYGSSSTRRIFRNWYENFYCGKI